MRKRAVGFCHAVHLFTSTNRVALSLGGFNQLSGQLVQHRAAGALPRGIDDPTHGQCQPALATHLYRHLVSRAANASGPNLQQRRRVANGSLKSLYWIVAVRGDIRQCAVDDAARRVSSCRAA